MDLIERRLHRLSLNQLKALFLLAKRPHAIGSSHMAGKKIGLKGKPLGGLFSSLARQKIGNEYLLIPWGKAADGRGLRWKLNTRLIAQKKITTIINELLQYE